MTQYKSFWNWLRFYALQYRSNFGISWSQQSITLLISHHQFPIIICLVSVQFWRQFLRCDFLNHTRDFITDGGGKKGLGICMTNISTGLPYKKKIPRWWEIFEKSHDEWWGRTREHARQARSAREGWWGNFIRPGNERRARAPFLFLSCSHHSLRPLFP